MMRGLSLSSIICVIFFLNSNALLFANCICDSYDSEFLLIQGSDINLVKRRVVLRAVNNTLTQSMVNSPNSTYVVQGTLYLNSDISIPENSSLVFEGGCIISKDGHTIRGNNTVLCAAPIKIFENVSFDGSFTAECTYAEWFFDYNEAIDCSPFFIKAIELAKHGINKIRLLKRKYCISNTIIVTNDLIIEGVCGGHFQGYDKTQLVCTDGINAIQLDGKPTNGGKEIFVSSITIKDIEIVGKNKIGVGIYYNSSDERYSWGCNGITLDNIRLKDFEYGFLLSGEGRCGSLQNTFRNCYITGCKIAVSITNSKYNNSFLFDRCLIHYNDWGGVLFHNSTTEALRFVDCSIERNGSCKSFSYNSEYGIFGVRIDKDTDPVLFDNCYFEGNVNNDYIEESADIVANNINVRNCLFSATSHIVSLKSLGQYSSFIHIEDCVIYDHNNKNCSKEALIDVGNVRKNSIIFLYNRWKSNGVSYTYRNKILNYNESFLSTISYEGQFVPNKPEIVIKK